MNAPRSEKMTTYKKVTKKRMAIKTHYKQKFTVPLKKKRKNEYNPKEEARLERIVFGDPSDIINSIPVDKDIIDSVKKPEIDVSENGTDNVSSEDIKAAWIDEDDEQQTLQEVGNVRSWKFSTSVPENLFKDYLQTKYKRLVGTPKWAELSKPDKSIDDLDNDILKHSCHLNKPMVKNLQKGLIYIKALTSINKKTHVEGPIVSSTEFHPTSSVALVAGSSGILSLFQVDGIENNKIHSMQYKKFPISTAKFLREGTEVLAGSQYYPHCHCYDLMAGKTWKIQLPHGITNMQKFEVSPDGKLLALCGRSGEIYLLTSSSKELVGTLKMNEKCRALCFTPDSKTLITHGDCNEMYIWDLNSRQCVHRAVDDGCLSCASIAITSSGQFLATGSKEGVVNLYDTKTVLESKNPQPLKIALNLVTSVTSLKFNPHSEILAMASSKKHNAFKLMHIPSFTIFSNFPTTQTNISMAEAIDFSPGSGYLSVSNRSGTALLYRLKHYGNY